MTIKIHELTEGKELDCLIDVEVFNAIFGEIKESRQYSTTVEYAFEAVDHIVNLTTSFDLYVSYENRNRKIHPSGYSANAVFRDNESNVIAQYRDKTIPLAICKAILYLMLKHYRDNKIETELED